MTPEEVRDMIRDVKEGTELSNFELSLLLDVSWYAIKTWELMGPVTIEGHTQAYAQPTAEQIEKLKQLQRGEMVA